jgi:hypothetical protein
VITTARRTARTHHSAVHGASPGGTGGGIKTTTFGAIVLDVVAVLLQETALPHDRVVASSQGGERLRGTQQVPIATNAERRIVLQRETWKGPERSGLKCEAMAGGRKKVESAT